MGNSEPQRLTLFNTNTSTSVGMEGAKNAMYSVPHAVVTPSSPSGSFAPPSPLSPSLRDLRIVVWNVNGLVSNKKKKSAVFCRFLKMLIL